MCKKKKPLRELIDNTMITTFDSCEKKFLYSFVENIARLEISPDLHAGGALAKGLEVARQTFYRDKKSQEESLLAGMEALIIEYGAFEAPHNHNKTFLATAMAFDAYLSEYPLSTDIIQPLMGVGKSPAIEFTFSIPSEVLHPITKNPILIGGRLDMLARYDDSFDVIVDEKTTKNFSFNWDEKWFLRSQFMGYCFAVQQYGYDVNRALIRGIAMQKTQYKFMEVLVEFKPSLIASWWKNLQLRLRRIVHAWETEEYIPSYADGCTAYFGCDFKELCLSDTPEKLYGNFSHRYWDPLAKDPTEPKEGITFEKIESLENLLKLGEI